MTASSHGTTCDTIILRCQRNGDTIDRTRYVLRILEAIIPLRLYTVFSTNTSLVEEKILVVWWMKRRLKEDNKSDKPDRVFFCSLRSDQGGEGFNIVTQGNRKISNFILYRITRYFLSDTTGLPHQAPQI